MATKILRLPQVIERTGLSRTTIYNRIADATFPKPIKLGERAVGWVDTEIDEWIQARITHTRDVITP